MLMCGSDLLGSSVPTFVRAHQERQVPRRAAARELRPAQETKGSEHSGTLGLKISGCVCVICVVIIN
jgi:hypothetical protein